MVYRRSDTSSSVSACFFFSGLQVFWGFLFILRGAEFLEIWADFGFCRAAEGSHPFGGHLEADGAVSAIDWCVDKSYHGAVLPHGARIWAGVVLRLTFFSDWR